MGLHLDVVAAARYLLSREIASLDAMWFAAEDKMAELGLSLNKRAAIVPEWQKGGPPTGNEAGIVAWINSLGADSDEADKANLVAIHATIRNRLAAAGYEPVRPE